MLVFSNQQCETPVTLQGQHSSVLSRSKAPIVTYCHSQKITGTDLRPEQPRTARCCCCDQLNILLLLLLLSFCVFTCAEPFDKVAMVCAAAKLVEERAVTKKAPLRCTRTHWLSFACSFRVRPTGNVKVTRCLPCPLQRLACTNPMCLSPLGVPLVTLNLYEVVCSSQGGQGLPLKAS